MLEKLKQEVLIANLELVKQELVIYTWGNVSGIDRQSNLVVIKPSGVSYDNMTVDDLVVIDLDGNVVEGKYKPSSDTPTHLALYKEFTDIGGIVHTHSENATAWAQAKKGIACYGTTHADYFYGKIPCTRELTNEEIANDYEFNTGLVIIEKIKELSFEPLVMPGILVASHGPFAWGESAIKAVSNAKVLEEVAKIAYKTKLINNEIMAVKDELLQKHFLRKHGKTAYYGQ